MINNLLLFLVLITLSTTAKSNWSTAKIAHRQVTVTGFSRARHTMVLSTEVEGRVEAVFADVGDQVSGHGKVACFDKTFVNIDINTAKNEIAQHQVDIRYFKKQVERYKALVGKKSAAVSQLDNFQRQLGNARRFEQDKKLRKQRLLEKQKRHCIISPIDWQIVERHVEPGQWLDIGSPVVNVADYTTLLVPLALSVKELEVLKKQPKIFKVLLPEYKQNVPATIERISPAFDDRSRKVQVDLLLKNKLPVHRGGIRVELRLDLPDSEGTYLVSEKVLDKRFEEVWLERKDGKKIRVELLGNATDGQVRIVSREIQAGDQFKIRQP